MIIDNEYFKNELYISHAKPSISSDVTTVSSELVAFIEKYERECLIKCFGFQLYKEFADELDSTQTNGLKETADVKWDKLLNGTAYTNPDGEEVVWRGIRFKNATTDTKPNRSFLANYVYWFWEQNSNIVVSGVGATKPKAKNAIVVNKTPNVVRAWREMVEMIQGRGANTTIIVKNYAYGIDYYIDDSEVNLYKFILDSNELVPDTYPNFKRNYWQNVQQNNFGL